MEQAYLGMMKNLYARESLIRLAQYSAYLLSTGCKPGSKAKAINLSMLLALARKVLRIGVPLAISFEVSKKLKTYSSLEWRLSLIPDAIKILVCLVDHVVLMYRIGVVKFSKKDLPAKISKLRNLLWLLHCIFSVSACAFKLYEAHSTLQRMVIVI